MQQRFFVLHGAAAPDGFDSASEAVDAATTAAHVDGVDGDAWIVARAVAIVRVVRTIETDRLDDEAAPGAEPAPVAAAADAEAPKKPRGRPRKVDVEAPVPVDLPAETPAPVATPEPAAVAALPAGVTVDDVADRAPYPPRVATPAPIAPAPIALPALDPARMRLLQVKDAARKVAGAMAAEARPFTTADVRAVIMGMAGPSLAPDDLIALANETLIHGRGTLWAPDLDDSMQTVWRLIVIEASAPVVVQRVDPADGLAAAVTAPALAAVEVRLSGADVEVRNGTTWHWQRYAGPRTAGKVAAEIEAAKDAPASLAAVLALLQSGRHPTFGSEA